MHRHSRGSIDLSDALKASPSFPNFCLGTLSCETLFRLEPVLAGAESETGVSRTDVPKQEFGNEGKTIELDEDLGVPEGQEVEVQVTVVPSVAPSMGEGLAKVYAVLGERFNSGTNDVAARHNEHQP
jgi:hypothetical protein